MPDINVWAVLVAGVAAFVASGGWYAVLGNAMVSLQARWRGAKAPEGPELWPMLGFGVSGLVVAAAVAAVLDLTETEDWLESAGIGLLLWVGFCATQWFSSILGEQVPVRLASTARRTGESTSWGSQPPRCRFARMTAGRFAGAMRSPTAQSSITRGPTVRLRNWCCARSCVVFPGIANE